jgi:short-subunit dehydrogenase
MAHSAIGRLATPERVAREGLDALGRKRVHVVGGLNKLSALLAQLAPRRLVTDMAARMMARTIPG